MARIAIVQDDCLWGEKAQNLEKATGLIKAAAQQNARLVLFPEMYLTGYALEDDIQQRAEAVSGPSIDALAQMAKTNQICICMGFPELDPASRQIFNSLVCLSDRGDILAVYRKIHLFDEEKKYFRDNSKIKIGKILEQDRRCHILMYIMDGNRSFPNCRGNPFYGSHTNIPGRKDAGHTGFKAHWVAFFYPI